MAKKADRREARFGVAVRSSFRSMIESCPLNKTCSAKLTVKNSYSPLFLPADSSLDSPGFYWRTAKFTGWVVGVVRNEPQHSTNVVSHASRALYKDGSLERVADRNKQNEIPNHYYLALNKVRNHQRCFQPLFAGR